MLPKNIKLRQNNQFCMTEKTIEKQNGNHQTVILKLAHNYI